MKKTQKKINKTKFILDNPSLRAREVVERAKGVGVTMTEKYVYNIRAKKKSQLGAAPRKPGRPRLNKEIDVARGSSEDVLVNAVLDLGLARAERVLAKIRESARSLTA